jgi:hypothetical protein
MKEALKRIQETLDRLETLKQSTAKPPTTDRSISFQILPVAPKAELPPPPAPKNDRLQLPQFPVGSVEMSPVGETTVERSPIEQLLIEQSRSAQSLEQVVRQIQALYHEGPIVDGWIDAAPTAPELDDEVEEIVFERPDLSCESDASLSLTNYHVCGVDESGQQWSYPCPVDQLLELSVAIARYHKLQELLAQKRQLEERLRTSAIGENSNKSCPI